MTPENRDCLATGRCIGQGGRLEGSTFAAAVNIGCCQAARGHNGSGWPVRGAGPTAHHACQSGRPPVLAECHQEQREFEGDIGDMLRKKAHRSLELYNGGGRRGATAMLS